MHCCLTSLCVYQQINSYQPPSGYLSITRSASGGSVRDLRRQQAQGVPKACKKAGFAPTGAVCRSGTRLPVHSRASPPGGKGVSPFPDLKYSAPAPCRSGSKGEAPWSLRKERNPGTSFLTIHACHKFSFFSFRTLDIFSFFGHNITEIAS